MELQQKYTEDMNIVIVGHVDHGKSTVIGRLLVDTKSLPIGKLEQVEEKCKRNSKPFEYAFLIDALKDEQEQGITIDSARCFFKTVNRNYIIVDAPGHIEFLKNMVTGASRAEAALLVIDAYEGIQENSKRHCYLLSMLGIKQLCVLVNKMDLANYRDKVYRKITEDFSIYLKQIGLNNCMYIPICGYKGENIVHRSKNMPWYHGDTVLEVLEKFQAEKIPDDKPFRMPVQGVYKFTAKNDSRRIIAGTVETGKLNVGDEIVFLPSGKKSKVKSIESFNENVKSSISAGFSTGFTLFEQIYVKRGEVATIYGQSRPQISRRIKAKIFWLGKSHMERCKPYYLKLGTAKVRIWIEEIIRVLDASTLESVKTDFIGTNAVAECILSLEKPTAFDLIFDNFFLSRFVIIDNYEICGGGIIYENLDGQQSVDREKVVLEPYKWQYSGISEKERTLKYKQRPTILIITGLKYSGKKYVAKALEKKLFDKGKIIYFLGIANILYGFDEGIKKLPYSREDDQLRRFGEISNIMLDAGNILVVTTSEMTSNDLNELKTMISPEKIKVVWIGKNVSTDIEYDLQINEDCSVENVVNRIEDLLIKDNIIDSYP